MKLLLNVFASLLLGSVVAHGQIIVADSYNVAGSGTGFGLNAGVNSGINPPTTRLTGTAAANLRYINTITVSSKTNTAFSITGNKLRVTSAANPGRFTLSADGATPFNLASVLGTDTATPLNPKVYDISISMANSTPGTQRFSFALGTAEGDATTWDFGVQLFRTTDSEDFYTIGKRIDTDASGLNSDLNFFIGNTPLGTFGSEINFLIRVTDAGSETTTFNSRVQVSMDGGLNWFYDTASDSGLPNGWRLKGAGRYLMWDTAPDAGNVTYDNFSIRAVPISAKPIAPVNNAQNLGASPTLTATISNTLSGNVTVTFYGRQTPKPGYGPDFLIPVLPDTQNYSDYTHDGLHSRWYDQTDWILDHRDSFNIPYVAQLGDLVQHGDTGNGAGNDEEWEVATNAMYRLENPALTGRPFGIPYGCCVGNHDQDPNGDEDGTTTHYNKYFGSAHFSGKPYYGGHFSTNGDSFFNLFSAGGMDFIVFSFEFNRYGSTILGWAQSVLATNQNRRVIVITHYAGSDHTPSSFGNGGQAIFDALKSNTNFFLMMGGHVFNGTGWGEGSRSDTVSGHTIHTLIANYQNRPSGGNGLMRLMFFSPSNNLVNIKTYSPYTDDYETDADSEFSFSYNMQPNGAGTPGTAYVALKTNSIVASGTPTSFVWSGVQPNKTYDWYVKVTDEFGNSVFSPASQFTTTVNSAPIANNQSITVTGDQPTPLTLSASDGNGDALTFQTNSAPIRGLNADFYPAHGTITYIPAHGYRGLDRFTYSASDGFATSSVATMNLTVVSPLDSNTNGLPDTWETTFGITDPNADNDGDGQNNLAEYMANTNPTNAASAFKVIQTDMQTNGMFHLTWSSVGGTRYRVEYSDTEIAGPFISLVRPIAYEMDASPYGSPSTQTFTDTLFPTNTARFYRVRIAP